jgi:hypothetical protein
MPNDNPNDSGHYPRSRFGKLFVRFWRSIYRPLGFSKGYNFPLFVILVGALMGFTLARFSYLNIAGNFLQVMIELFMCLSQVSSGANAWTGCHSGGMVLVWERFSSNWDYSTSRDYPPCRISRVLSIRPGHSTQAAHCPPHKRLRYHHFVPHQYGRGLYNYSACGGWTSEYTSCNPYTGHRYDHLH